MEEHQEEREKAVNRRWNQVRWGAVGVIVLTLVGEAFAHWYFTRDESRKAAFEPYAGTIDSAVTTILIVSCVLVYLGSRMRSTAVVDSEHAA
ncbi:hypothetical protein [Rubinisphaera margarita]|uniref:hypothetical protein n=1 Tax=Rubinisphaera margarita TaxID=2909586 RepID=UPI001EE8A824|nr:hypothetical protein [Rubinisphaera margarita]MCG6154880.1 hypothetical protein [Rubinisphaera margarita]